MGFLSKLKNKVTGGWADVTVEAPSARAGTTTTVAATVVVKGEPIDIEAVRIQVRFRLEQPTIDHNPMDHVKPEPTYSYTTYGDEVVAGPQTLEAGSHHSYTATVSLPERLTSEAQNSTWQARALVTMPGNDPDSGWVSFHVSS